MTDDEMEAYLIGRADEKRASDRAAAAEIQAQYDADMERLQKEDAIAQEAFRMGRAEGRRLQLEESIAAVSGALNGYFPSALLALGALRRNCPADANAVIWHLSPVEAKLVLDAVSSKLGGACSHAIERLRLAIERANGNG